MNIFVCVCLCMCKDCRKSVWELVITSNVPDHSFDVYYLVNLISTLLYMVNYKFLYSSSCCTLLLLLL